MIEDINNLTSRVLGLAFEVHTQLGAGLLESTYESCLFYELRANAIDVERQKKLPIIYKLLDKYKINHNIIIFKSRAEADNYIYNMEKKYEKV